MESELFERFKANSNQALAAYFDRHARALIFFARRIVSDTYVAEELVQDAYVKLWMARERIANDAHIKSFLYRTTRNSCIDHLRATGHRIQGSTCELDENIRQPDNDLLAHMIHAETLHLVYLEVKKLSPTQQQIFQLSFIDGLSTQEICAALGMTSNAVFVARSKALATLQRLFNGKDLLIFLTFLKLVGLEQTTG